MSATNRGSVRREADFYATPLQTVRQFLESYDGIKDSDLILEPSAGNGNIISALREKGYVNHITAVELRNEERSNLVNAGANQIVSGDFLQFNPADKYDVVIGNPPFSLAREFVDKSIECCTDGGHVIFLLRTSFLESKSRFEWWKSNPLTGLYTLHNRPSFTGRGTDACSYSWFVWTKQKSESQIIKII